MEIAEVKHKKKLLEKAVEDLLQKFQEDTKVNVADMNLSQNVFRQVGPTEDIYLQTVSITLNL